MTDSNYPRDAKQNVSATAAPLKKAEARNDASAGSVLKSRRGGVGVQPLRILSSVHLFIHPSQVRPANVFSRERRGGSIDVASSSGSRQGTGDLIDC